MSKARNKSAAGISLGMLLGLTIGFYLAHPVWGLLIGMFVGLIARGNATRQKMVTVQELSSEGKQHKKHNESQRRWNKL